MILLLTAGHPDDQQRFGTILDGSGQREHLGQSCERFRAHADRPVDSAPNSGSVPNERTSKLLIGRAEASAEFSFRDSHRNLPTSLLGREVFGQRNQEVCRDSLALPTFLHQILVPRGIRIMSMLVVKIIVVTVLETILQLHLFHNCSIAIENICRRDKNKSFKITQTTHGP